MLVSHKRLPVTIRVGDSTIRLSHDPHGRGRIRIAVDAPAGVPIVLGDASPGKVAEIERRAAAAAMQGGG